MTDATAASQKKLRPPTQRAVRRAARAAEIAAEYAPYTDTAREQRHRNSATTARALGLLPCTSCGLVNAPAAEVQVEEESAASDASQEGIPACARCGAELHSRKPGSIARTWAYLIAAFILYIPANVLPISNTRTLFDEQSDTIFSGVVYLWLDGSWPLALLVFFASIVVPMAKLIVMSVLAISVQRHSLRKPAQRTRLYRIVEFIGRWSMLDIYAVAILTALVQLRSLAEVTAGPAVLAFGAVCVLTILASHAFDPRLIWDPIDMTHIDPDEDDD